MNERVRTEIDRRRSLEAERAARLSGWTRGEKPGPFKLMYFPTNACNLRCAICWQRRGVYDYSELPPERQVALINEAIALDVRELVIGGGGEPLARWNRLKPLFRTARDAGLYGMLFTNGTLISEEVATSLVDMEWSKVLISLDGPQGANDEVRGAGTFERIIGGLDRLLSARAGRPFPVVGVGCVMTRQGVRGLPALVRLLADRGCDQLNLIRLVVHCGDQQQYAVKHSEMSRFQEALRETQGIAEAAGMVTNLREYMDEEIITKTESFDHILLSDRTQAPDSDPFWGALCFEPFSNVVIHANGMVGPCCMSGDDPVASVVSRTLADTWLGEEFARLREGILSRRPELYCRTCDLNVFAENQRLRAIGRSL